jgi:hypothetical protein
MLPEKVLQIRILTATNIYDKIKLTHNFHSAPEQNSVRREFTPAARPCGGHPGRGRAGAARSRRRPRRC